MGRPSVFLGLPSDQSDSGDEEDSDSDRSGGVARRFD